MSIAYGKFLQLCHKPKSTQKESCTTFMLLISMTLLSVHSNRHEIKTAVEKINLGMGTGRTLESLKLNSLSTTRVLVLQGKIILYHIILYLNCPQFILATIIRNLSTDNYPILN